MNGIIQVLAIEAYFDEAFGLNAGERLERGMEIFEDRVMPLDDSVGWIPLRKAIKRNAMFSVEASSPAMDIELRFAPGVSGGSYKLTSLPRGEIEAGRIQKVIDVPVDSEDRRLIKVRQFQHQYVIASTTNLHPFKRKAWIIGIDDPVQTINE